MTRRRYVPRRLRRDLGPRWHITVPTIDHDQIVAIRALYPWARAAIFSLADITVTRLR